MPSTFPIGPSLRTMASCSTKSSSVKPSPEASFPAMAVAWSSSKVRSACSISVRTSPRSRIRDAIRSGWKRSKSSSFSPDEANITGRPVSWAIDSAAARIAIQLGEHHAVVADAVQERLRRDHGVLADHGIDNEQDLVRIDGIPDACGLAHHLLVDAEAPGGVDDHDVVQPVPGLVQRAARDVDRISHPVARRGGEHGHGRLLTEYLQLLHGVGPLQVGSDEQRGVALLAEPQRELRRQRGLAGALQASQHDHSRWLLGEAQPPGLAAEDLDELLVNDLDDLLGRVQRRGHLFAGRALLDPGDEGPDHWPGDIRLKQRDPYLAAGGVDVGGGKPAVPAQRGEDLGEPVGKSLEHLMAAVLAQVPVVRGARHGGPSRLAYAPASRPGGSAHLSAALADSRLSSPATRPGNRG